MHIWCNLHVSLEKDEFYSATYRAGAFVDQFSSLFSLKHHILLHVMDTTDRLRTDHLSICEPTSHLVNLPKELIERICGYLMGYRFWPRVEFREMYPLRLTCRRIERNTSYVFGKAAFTRLDYVRLNTRSLERLSALSRCPEFAVSVRRIGLSQYFRVEDKELLAAQKDAISLDLPEAERQKAQSLVSLGNFERDDRDFINRYVESPASRSISLSALELEIRCGRPLLYPD